MKISRQWKLIKQVAWEGKSYDDMLIAEGHGYPVYDEEGGQVGEEEVKSRPYFLYLFGAIFSTTIAPLICKYRGHDIVDQGHGGPESGCMDHECLRCGEYWSVPLY